MSSHTSSIDVGQATIQAFYLLFSGDSNLWEIIATSLSISFFALFVATPISLSIAYWLSIHYFRGKRSVVITLQGLLSLPTVVIGLLLYMLLSRSGPLGAWNLLFTPWAISIGQILIAIPVLIVFFLSALQKNDLLVRETAKGLGANFGRVALTEFYEARFGLYAAILAAFGRVISEVGSALIVGGNIAHYTRTITTAITLETGKGSFAEGIALGIVLITLAVGASALLSFFQGEGRL